jgi:hypothetical protein
VLRLSATQATRAVCTDGRRGKTVGDKIASVPVHLGGPALLLGAEAAQRRRDGPRRRIHRAPAAAQAPHLHQSDSHCRSLTARQLAVLYRLQIAGCAVQEASAGFASLVCSRGTLERKKVFSAVWRPPSLPLVGAACAPVNAGSSRTVVWGPVSSACRYQKNL